jgi:hypothetical protein
LNHQIRVLTMSMNSLRRENLEIKNEMLLFKATKNNTLRNLNDSVKRIGQIPAVRAAHGARNQIAVAEEQGMDVDNDGDNVMAQEVVPNANNNEIPFQSTLTKCPMSLFVLWNEWEFGIGGQKPAKLFSSKERGRVKSAYSLRKPFWVRIGRMIRGGYTASTAVDKIYSVYPGRSTTKVLQDIRRDEKNGGHADLRV